MFLLKNSFRIFIFSSVLCSVSSMHGMDFLRRFASYFSSSFVSPPDEKVPTVDNPSKFRFAGTGFNDPSIKDFSGYPADDITEEEFLQIYNLENPSDNNSSEKTVFIGKSPLKVTEHQHNGVRVLRAKPLLQPVGGMASCGYHTIKNGGAAVRAFLGHSEGDCLSKDLTSPRSIHPFETRRGKWRKLIIDGRQERHLRNKLSEYSKLFVFSPTEDDGPFKKEKVRSFFSTVLDCRAEETARQIFGKKACLDPVDIARKIVKKKSEFDIKEYYEQKPKLKDGESLRDHLANFLCSEGTQKKYINFDLLKQFPTTPGKREDGEWLASEEIQRIIDLEEESGMLKEAAKNMSLIVQDDCELLENGEVGLNREEIFDACKRSMINPKHVTWFCIGTMGNLRGTRGHWFPLVLQGDVGCVMDSLYFSHSKDRLVHKMIDTFKHEKSKLKTTVKSLAGFSAGQNIHGPVLGIRALAKRRSLIKEGDL